MTGPRFARAVARDAARADVSLAIEHHCAVAWHSATFSGARHELVVSATADDALDGWLARLPSFDPTIPGQIVADLHVAARVPYGDRVMLRLEGVTVACDLSGPECGTTSVRGAAGRRMPPPTPACTGAAHPGRTR